ncbi:MAG: carboxymuconolactone decarboxylase family protein [Capsulimonadaceae bacterium]
MNRDFPTYRKHLQGLSRRLKQRAPGLMAGFAELHEKSMAPGALDLKQKELMALGIGIASRCDGCIAFHMHEALANGASLEEIEETIGVAVLMGGGPVLMYGLHALEAMEQFQTGSDLSHWQPEMSALGSGR